MRNRTEADRIPVFRPLHVELAAVYICDVCHQPFSSQRDAQQHFCIDSKQKSSAQLHSPMSISNASQNVETVEQEDKELDHKFNAKLKCKFCGANYKLLRNLNMHTKQHYTETPGRIQCARKGCEQHYFSSVPELKWHIKTHGLKCDECDNFFASSKLLRGHKMRHHSKVRPFRYNVPNCSFSGFCKSNLEQHKGTIHGFYKCHLCSKACASSSSLRGHTNLHKTSIQGVFKCAISNCNYTTHISTNDLESHLLSHEVNRTFCSIACDVEDCNEKFKSLKNFREHKSIVHCSSF